MQFYIDSTFSYSETRIFILRLSVQNSVGILCEKIFSSSEPVCVFETIIPLLKIAFSEISNNFFRRKKKNMHFTICPFKKLYPLKAMEQTS